MIFWISSLILLKHIEFNPQQSTCIRCSVPSWCRSGFHPTSAWSSSSPAVWSGRRLQLCRRLRFFGQFVGGKKNIVSHDIVTWGMSSPGRLLIPSSSILPWNPWTLAQAEMIKVSCRRVSSWSHYIHISVDGKVLCLLYLVQYLVPSPTVFERLWFFLASSAVSFVLWPHLKLRKRCFRTPSLFCQTELPTDATLFCCTNMYGSMAQNSLPTPKNGGFRTVQTSCSNMAKLVAPLVPWLNPTTSIHQYPSLL